MKKLTKKQIVCKQLTEQIIQEAEYLLEDHALPNNVLGIIRNIKTKLSKDLCAVELSSMLYALEETINSVNAMEHRSLVWSLISKLENLKENIK